MDPDTSLREVIHAVLALLDGTPRLVDPTMPILRADDLGVARGEAVFETLRVASGRPAFLSLHLERLARSAARLAIALPDGWAELAGFATAAYEAAYGADAGVLRLTCTKGPPGGLPVGFALVTPVPAETLSARLNGVNVVTLTLGVTAGVRTTAPWLLGGVKSTSYAVNMASIRAAEAEGAHDVVWVSSDGYVLEAPTATVAWVAGGRLVTPPPDEVGILAGTTVAVALGLAEVAVDIRLGTLEELRAADEVMLLSSVRGVAPVLRLDGQELGVGPVTAALREAFEQAVQKG